jgi:hypothetical protein
MNYISQTIIYVSYQLLGLVTEKSHLRISLYNPPRELLIFVMSPIASILNDRSFISGQEKLHVVNFLLHLFYRGNLL